MEASVPLYMQLLWGKSPLALSNEGLLQDACNTSLLTVACKEIWEALVLCIALPCTFSLLCARMVILMRLCLFTPYSRLYSDLALPTCCQTAAECKQRGEATLNLGRGTHKWPPFLSSPTIHHQPPSKKSPNQKIC